MIDNGLFVALDTCSEVSIGLIHVLKDVRLARKPVCVEGIGGTIILEMEGSILLADKSEITLFCVDECELPPGTQILVLCHCIIVVANTVRILECGIPVIVRVLVTC